MSNIEVEFDFCRETQYFHIIQAITKARCKLSMKLETCKYWKIWSLLESFTQHRISLFHCYEFYLSLALMYDIDEYLGIHILALKGYNAIPFKNYAAFWDTVILGVLSYNVIHLIFLE